MDAMTFLSSNLAGLLALGVAAGFLAGLIGIGGGFVIVPGLAALLAGIPALADREVALAIGTATGCMLFTGGASAGAQLRRGSVSVAAVRRLAPWMGLGAAAGAGASMVFPAHGAAIAFGLFCVYSGASFAIGRDTPVVEGWSVASGPARLPGLAMGVLCGMVGVGGTNLVVPYLQRRGETLRTGLGTTSALQVPMAVLGALAYSVGPGTGLDRMGNLGLICLPALAVLSAAALLGAPLGVRAGHWLSAPMLRKVFGVFTAAVGLKMLGAPLPLACGVTVVVVGVAIAWTMAVRRQRRRLLRASPADVWRVEVNGVEVGALSDSDYEAIRLTVLESWEVYGAQAASVLRASSIFVARMVFDAPYILIAAGCLVVLVAPQSLSTWVDQLRAASGAAVVDKVRAVLPAALGAVLLVNVMQVVAGAVLRLPGAGLGVTNRFSEAIAYRIRRQLRVAAVGSVRLLRAPPVAGATPGAGLVDLELELRVRTDAACAAVAPEASFVNQQEREL